MEAYLQPHMVSTEDIDGHVVVVHLTQRADGLSVQSLLLVTPTRLVVQIAHLIQSSSFLHLNTTRKGEGSFNWVHPI